MLQPHIQADNQDDTWNNGFHGGDLEDLDARVELVEAFGDVENAGQLQCVDYVPKNAYARIINDFLSDDQAASLC